MATTTGKSATAGQPAPVKLPAPFGRPEGKGLEPITKSEGRRPSNARSSPA